MSLDFSALPETKISSRYSSRKFPLHAMTVFSGHSRETSASYYNDGKAGDISSYAVWQYTISGRGRIDLPAGPQDLLPGSLMILSVPGPQVYYLPENSEHWEFVFLVMIGREAIRITRIIEQRLGNIIDTKGLTETLDLFHEILSKLFEGEINDPFINSDYTYRLCMTFLKETANLRYAPGKQFFEELKKFLKENLYRDISVEEMAELIHLSRSHFSRLLSREMGMSPRLYLEDLRLKTAIDMLFQEGVSVKEAAARCGIYDVNYFCRLFKKRYGVSPGKYREGHYREPPST
jgi:AraC-like DNA-binding protein